jgi:cytochrome d ubiquinol oxidase subunit II
VNSTLSHSLLTNAWFCLLGLMLVLYVVTDGFDLGVGILSLLHPEEHERDLMTQSIGHVWDANETWLVVLGGALFGAFPDAYAMLLQGLYIPVMTLIASLIMRGAAIEFRHAATRYRLWWDRVFGIGSLLAAVSQGVVLGKIVTGMLPGRLQVGFVALVAVGVVSGYALLGATWLVKKTTGMVELAARQYATLAAFTTVAVAIILSIGTLMVSPVDATRWSQPGIFPLLAALAAVAALAFCYVVYAVNTGGVRGPFTASVLLFVVSFVGLAVSMFPYLVPGRLTIAAAASNSPTLVFMLLGIGMILPVMVGYNLYQYHLFRGKVRSIQH